MKVSATQTWSIAEDAVARLRKAGLHPLDLSLSTPLANPDVKPTYSIEVPLEEVDEARKLVIPSGS